VLDQVALLSEGFLAVLATEGSFAGMLPNVVLDITALAEVPLAPGPQTGENQLLLRFCLIPFSIAFIIFFYRFFWFFMTIRLRFYAKLDFILQ